MLIRTSGCAGKAFGRLEKTHNIQTSLVYYKELGFSIIRMAKNEKSPVLARDNFSGKRLDFLHRIRYNDNAFGVIAQLVRAPR